MADSKSNYLERKILDHALGTTTYTKPTNVFVALHTANPADDASGSEVSGGSYARQDVDFNAASTDGSGNSTAVSSTGQTFANMPTVTVTHIGIWDAASGGNLLYYGPLAASKSTTSGDTLSIAAGQLSVKEQ